MSTRVSNETLAKALVKAFEDLDVKLDKFKKDTEKLVSKPMSVDSNELEERIQKLQSLQESLKTTISQGKQDLTKPFWLWIAGICFATLLVAIGLFVYNSSHNNYIEKLERNDRLLTNILTYFDENKQANQDYENWAKRK
jgi:hypothetical protein